MPFDVTEFFKPKKGVKPPPAPQATGPWMNNFQPETYGGGGGRYNPVIPKLGTDAQGFPDLPADAFNLDTAIPWEDAQHIKSIDKIIGLGSQRVGALDKLVEQRGANAEQIIRDALAKSSGPAMGEKDINAAFGQEADRASQGYLGDVGGLRDYLGSAGVGGGYAAGLASQLQMQRMGQITDAKRSITLEAAKLNTQKAMADFNNTLSLASVVNRDPAMLGMDWLQNILDLRLQQSGVDKQDRAAKEANKAAKKAGTLQGIGSILGAVGGLFG